MPESVTDRPTKAHSYLFLLSKSPRYFFDQEAVREAFQDPREGGDGFRWNSPHYTEQKGPVDNTLGGLPPEAPRGPDGRRQTHVQGQDGSLQHRDGERWPNSGRNVRSVWSIPTQPYPEAHFATFPEELARRCIAAGTSERGCCPECLAPWVREVEREPMLVREGPGRAGLKDAAAGSASGTQRTAITGTMLRAPSSQTVGWRPSCDCSNSIIQTPGRAIAHPPNPPVPCVVLDPFVGSGTVPHVARKLGRHAIGIDLNADYLELASRRLAQQSLLASPVVAVLEGNPA
jgi:hypothetical protein